MAHIQKIVGGGATFQDLIQFVDECKEKKLPLNTPVKIDQHSDTFCSDVLDIQGDEENIVFYDWL